MRSRVSSARAQFKVNKWSRLRVLTFKLQPDQDCQSSEPARSSTRAGGSQESSIVLAELDWLLCLRARAELAVAAATSRPYGRRADELARIKRQVCARLSLKTSRILPDPLGQGGRMSPISSGSLEQQEPARFYEPTGCAVVSHAPKLGAPNAARKQVKRSIQIERRATGSKSHHGQAVSPDSNRMTIPSSNSQSKAKQPKPGEELAPSNSDNVCAGCLKPIRERYLLVALDKRWHEDCLKCACCDCRLGEVGSSLFTHSDKILCRRDFLRIFGQQGQCAACKKTIPPYELVMRSNELAYHMDCFACQQCQYRFCVGDRYHLSERHRIICLLCHADSAIPQALERAHENGANQEAILAAPPDAGSKSTEPADLPLSAGHR